MRIEAQLIVRIAPALKRGLRKLARETDLPEAAHVREALKRYLESPDTLKNTPAE